MDAVKFANLRRTHATRIGREVGFFLLLWTIIMIGPKEGRYHSMYIIECWFFGTVTFLYVIAQMISIRDVLQRQWLVIDKGGIAFDDHRFAWDGIRSVEVVKSFSKPAIRIMPYEGGPSWEKDDEMSGMRVLGELGRDIVFDEWNASSDELIETMRRFYDAHGPESTRAFARSQTLYANAPATTQPTP